MKTKHTHTHAVSDFSLDDNAMHEQHRKNRAKKTLSAGNSKTRFSLNFPFLSSSNTYLKKERKRRWEGKERMFALWERSFKATLFAPHTQPNTNGNVLSHTTHCGRRQSALFTTVYLSDTISGSDIWKKLGSSGGEVESSCYVHAWCSARASYFPASATEHKGGHVSFPLYPQRYNTNFSRSLGHKKGKTSWQGVIFPAVTNSAWTTTSCGTKVTEVSTIASGTPRWNGEISYLTWRAYSG